MEQRVAVLFYSKIPSKQQLIKNRYPAFDNSVIGSLITQGIQQRKIVLTDTDIMCCIQHSVPGIFLQFSPHFQTQVLETLQATNPEQFDI